jgi:hypothetical protein
MDAWTVPILEHDNQQYISLYTGYSNGHMYTSPSFYATDGYKDYPTNE